MTVDTNFHVKSHFSHLRRFRLMQHDGIFLLYLAVKPSAYTHEKVGNVTGRIEKLPLAV